MAIAPSAGYRPRLTGLVTCYGRRVGDPRAPASNFSSHLMSLKVVPLSPSLLPLPPCGGAGSATPIRGGKSRVSELNPPPHRFRDIEIEPRLLACVEQIEQRRDLAIVVVAVAVIVARRIA